MTNQVRPVITFSHRYDKLCDENKRVFRFPMLIDVLLVDLEDLTPLRWKRTNKFWPNSLPCRGGFLMLVFWKQGMGREARNDNTFMTLRRLTSEKHKYYKARIGQEFEVRIKEGWKS